MAVGPTDALPVGASGALPGLGLYIDEKALGHDRVEGLKVRRTPQQTARRPIPD
jgi:hypothetical protein